MKKVMIWFLLSCKRYVRKPSFLVILLLLPLGILAADKSQGHKDPEIKIAVSVQGGDENELGARLAQSLVERRLGEDAGMFRFYECRDEEQVKDEVASRRAECGYVITQGLREKLDSGQYRRSILVYSAPSTVTASLSTETVFAALMEDTWQRKACLIPWEHREARPGKNQPWRPARFMTNGLAMEAPSGLNTASRDRTVPRPWLVRSLRRPYFR